MLVSVSRVAGGIAPAVNHDVGVVVVDVGVGCRVVCVNVGDGIGVGMYACDVWL